MKILIVDDKKENLYFLERILKKMGKEVVMAENGEQALKKLNNDNIKMIISDILMPVMDGFQLCKTVKSNKKFNDVLFVFYTATYIKKEDEEFALDLGADKFLRKPLKPEKFIEIIKNLIQKTEISQVKPSKTIIKEEKEILKLYNERLIHKLEQKVLALEKETIKYKKVEWYLGENVKELTCLYNILKLFEESDLSIKQFFVETLEFIPSAWQFPDVTCARIIYHGQEFKTENFDETIWKQNANIIEYEKIVGSIDVYYLKDKPESDEGLFLKEEKDLINAIAEILSRFIERKKAEDSLKKINRAFKMLSESNLLLSTVKNESELLHKLCSIIIEIGGYRLAWVGLVEHDEEKTVRPVSQVGFEDGYLEHIDITWADTERGQGPTGTAIRTHKYYIARNIKIDPKFEPWREQAIKRGYNSSISLPLILENNVIYTLNVYSAEKEAFNKEEVDLLIDLVNNLSIGIEKIRSYGIQKKIEEELKQSEKKFRTIFQSIPDLFFLVSEDSSILEYKGKSQDLYISPEKFLGKKMADLLPPNLGKLNYALIKKTINTKQLQLLEYSLPFNNEIRFFEARHLYFSENKIAIFIRDITDRKNIEKALKESEEKYRLISENANDSIAILNEKFQIEYRNEEVNRKITGYTKEEVINNNFLNFVHPNDVKKAISIFKEAFKVGEGMGEFRSKTKKGDYIWLESKGKIFIDKDEQKKVLIISRDITERKKAEEELAKSAMKYQELFNTSPFSIALVNFDGLILDCNIANVTLTGFEKSELIGKYFNETGLFSPEDEKLMRRNSLNLIKRNPTKPIECKLTQKNGEVKWIYMEVSLFEVGDQTFQRVASYDITERKKADDLRREFSEKLEQEVKLRTQELNQALELQKLYQEQILKSSQFKSEFMASMSHELRTPLNSIIGFTDILLEGYYGKINEKQDQYLNDVRSSGAHLLDLINKILDISKIEAGEIKLNIEEIQLKNIIHQVKNTIEPMYKKKRLKFEIIGLDEEKVIQADPIRLKEIFYNLLSNAVKYTKEGGFKLEILEHEHHWEFNVIDTGIGIAKEDFDLIFKEFKRAKSDYVASVEGTGLGLSLIKKLINLHGGNISFTSELGKGTTFTFTLPKNI